MARRGSGLRAAIQVGKAINRAHKQYVREVERQRKVDEKKRVQQQREYERVLREQEREAAARERTRVAAEKAQFKREIEGAKEAFEQRCEKRKLLREKMINEVLR